MSTFVSRTLNCPHCGAASDRTVAASLNGPRVPQHRKAILDDTFQRFTCDACGKVYQADAPFIWLDFDAHHWIGIYPRAWESNWRQLEKEPEESWRRNLVENAPPSIQAIAGDFIIRAVFGLEALRDKLVCLEAGLDDVLLEVLKLDLMRSGDGLVLHPDARLSLLRIEDDMLVFNVRVPREGGGWRRAEVSAPKDLLDDLERERDAWKAAIDAVSGGPYVDVGRMLIPGEGS